MSTAVRSDPGWTISEAKVHTNGPEIMGSIQNLEHVLQLIAEEEARNALYVNGEIFKRPNPRRDQVQAELDDARRNILTPLRNNLRHGHLVAWGNKNGIHGDRLRIPAHLWSSLFLLEEANVAATPTEPPETFWAVEIFPVLTSPERAELIAGRALRDIVKDHIFEDPVVVKLAKGATPNAAPALLWQDAELPRLPAVDDIDQLRCIFQGYWKGAHPTRDGNAFDKLAGAVASRFAALARLLRTRVVSVEGTSATKGTGQIVAITDDLFRQSGTRICLATGDIWAEAEGHQVERLFESVEIKAPRAVVTEASEGATTANNRPRGGRPRKDFWPVVLNRTLTDKLLELSDAGRFSMDLLGADHKAFKQAMAIQAEKKITEDGSEVKAGYDGSMENLPDNAEGHLKEFYRKFWDRLG
jgi:hypothetical protein